MLMKFLFRIFVSFSFFFSPFSFSYSFVAWPNRCALAPAGALVMICRRHSRHGAAAPQMMEDSVARVARAQRHGLDAVDGQRQDNEPEKGRK